MTKDKADFYTFPEIMKKGNLLSASEEDYLEMLYRLLLTEKFIRVNDLAKALHVRPASVTNMLKRLSEKKLILHRDYGAVELTDTGEEIGKSLLDRHNIVEQFLKILKINNTLLEETEKIEHTLSIETLRALKKAVRFFHDNPDILKKFEDFL